MIERSFTLGRFEVESRTDRLVVPGSAAWSLEELGIARGRQELFTRQAPQVLRRLRESAMIESAISSNRIEGVEVALARAGTVVFGTAQLHDRDEEEVRGYRDALRLIHESHERLGIGEETIRRLHGLSRAGRGDAGEFKTGTATSSRSCHRVIREYGFGP